MSEHIIAEADVLEEGERLLIEVEGREIAVFNIEGEYYAYANWCSHQGGPVCQGKLTGRMEATYDADSLETELEWTSENSTLVCPWHDWEFDIETGDCLSSDSELLSYTTWVEDGEIKIRL